jgi:hypothetical protein
MDNKGGNTSLTRRPAEWNRAPHKYAEKRLWMESWTSTVSGRADFVLIRPRCSS